MMLNRRNALLTGAAMGLALAASSAALAQDAVRLRDELLRLETQSWQDSKDRNIAGLRPFLADDVLLIFGDGTRYDKPAYLKAVARDFTVHSFTVEPGSSIMPVTSDVAILLYRVTYTSATGKEKPSTMTAAASSTYVRRGGKWLSVFYQETPTK